MSADLKNFKVGDNSTTKNKVKYILNIGMKTISKQLLKGAKTND